MQYGRVIYCTFLNRGNDCNLRKKSEPPWLALTVPGANTDLTRNERWARAPLEVPACARGRTAACRLPTNAGSPVRASSGHSRMHSHLLHGPVGR